MLFVNEIFASVQGEGRFTGTPCVFVRFQGCPVRCPWCDTREAMAPGTPNGVGLTDTAFQNHASHATAEPGQLWQYVRGQWPHFRHLVLTGGEPCAQETTALAAFCAFVRRSEQEGQGWQIHVETSGTCPVDWIPDNAWVTLSPKSGTLPVLPQALHRADEIKMVVATQADIDWLDSLLATVPAQGAGHAPVCLQPRSQDSAATALCLETVMARADRDYSLSVQTHKYLGVR